MACWGLTNLQPRLPPLLLRRRSCGRSRRRRHKHQARRLGLDS